MSEAIFIKRRSLAAGEVGLFAVDDEGRELLGRIKDGKQVGADVIQRRNARHHRLYFAMLKFLSEHVDMFAGRDVELISISLKLATGLVRTYVEAETGKTVMVPLSISWGAMDQTKFAEFFDAALVTICTRWLVGSDVEEARAEIERMADPIGYGRAA